MIVASVFSRIEVISLKKKQRSSGPCARAVMEAYLKRKQNLLPSDIYSATIDFMMSLFATITSEIITLNAPALRD